jgi:hypothetical protein
MGKNLVTLHFDRKDICNCIQYANDVFLHDILNEAYQTESLGSGLYDISEDFNPLGKSAEELYTYAVKRSPKLNQTVKTRKTIKCKLFFCSDICVASENYMDDNDDSISWLNNDSSFTVTHCRDYILPLFYNPLGKNNKEINKDCLNPDGSLVDEFEE